MAARSSTALSWTVAGGFLLSLWSTRAAVAAMIRALNIVYAEEEKRGLVKLALTSLLLTLAALLGGALALLLVAVAPAVLCRFGPSRARARWSWVSWGAAAATLLWVAASVGFSQFVANFGRYGETYGAIAGVVLLLMWLWISALVALIGAEINSETEYQTRRDTTEGPEKPMGARRAWVADHVARSP